MFTKTQIQLHVVLALDFFNRGNTPVFLKNTQVELIQKGTLLMFGSESTKRLFLLDELWRLSIQGAFSTRNSKIKIYKEDAKDNDKDKFKNCLREKIEDYIIPQYTDCKIGDKEHCSNIKKVRLYFLECNKSHAVLEGVPNIGICQKLLNLYLKYLWCLNEIPMPPHCPIDSVVLREANIKANWTEISTIGEYVDIVNSIKSKTGCLPLSIWELTIYNKNRR